jgi:predicted RNA methylase
MDEIPEDDPALPRGCVPYLPCPVTTVLEALDLAGVSRRDVFVDVGSGLGRVTALVHLLTRAACIGLEIQSRLILSARERIETLGLSDVSFVEGDAVEEVRTLTEATVFFLYCPFGGTRLARVVDDLEQLARSRPLRICCVGLPALDRPWLSPLPAATPDLTVYRATAPAP